ncbi:MAG: hypothetical protein AAB367_01230 [Patescibacteria group bacterium]
MILVTHSIIGSAVVNTAVSVGGAFAAGVLSHYLFDMIPHWHYHVPKIKEISLRVPGSQPAKITKALLRDIQWVALDLSAGFILSFLFFGGSWLVIAAGAFGAVLPDLMVGAAKFWPQRLLILHDKFHRWNHTDIRLDDRPILGISTQAGIAILFVLLFR